MPARDQPSTVRPPCRRAWYGAFSIRGVWSGMVGSETYISPKHRSVVGCHVRAGGPDVTPNHGRLISPPEVPMQPLVGIIMGSKSDWETLSHAADTLTKLGVPHEVRVVSAHRTPDLLFEYAGTAEARGLQVIIAGAGGAAHLSG